MSQKCFFLCGNFQNMSFIYGVKVEKGDFYYFDEVDSIIGAHGSLPADLENRIRQLQNNTLKPISISLDTNQLANYMNNDRFIFKGKELMTCNNLI